MPCNGDCNQGRECICECKKETNMTKQHKWHKEIKAWADGEEIEYKNNSRKMCWTKYESPLFDTEDGYEYRIKPQPKEPKYLYAFIYNGTAMLTDGAGTNGGRYIGKIEVQDDKP